MNKAGWAGSVMAAMLLTSGGASAQSLQPRLSYPQDQGDLADEAPPPNEDGQDIRDRPAEQPRADDDFSDVVSGDDSRIGEEDRDAGYGRGDNHAEATPPDAESEDAITYCALAARDEAERDGGYAEVRQMQQPRETRNGHDVEGDLEWRSNWRSQDGAMRHFTCSLRNGRVADIWFQRDRAAR